MNPYTDKGENAIGVLQWSDDGSPNMLVYADENGEPLVSEWVDFHEDISIYFTYRVTRANLADFIQDNLSHYGMIMSCSGGIGMLTRMHEDEAETTVEPLEIEWMSEEWLPDPTDYFSDYDDHVDVQPIVSYFNLDTISPPIIDKYRAVRTIIRELEQRIRKADIEIEKLTVMRDIMNRDLKELWERMSGIDLNGGKEDDTGREN